MGLRFEWDRRKAEANWRKHGVRFEDAATVFADPLSRTIPDSEDQAGEERCVTLGVSRGQQLLVVIHADRGDIIRIISAREATRRERHAYEEVDIR